MIRTQRLLLRDLVAADRPALLDLLSSPEVYAHLGGPRTRAALEAALPAVPPARPGHLVVDLDDALIGTVSLERRDPARPGRVRSEGGELELSYLFLPRAWGHGYAAEACAAVLARSDADAPGEPVVVCTQSTNTASVRLAGRLGFTEVVRFEEFGAEQWFGVRHPA